jgi:hypothetical protein
VNSTGISDRAILQAISCYGDETWRLSFYGVQCGLYISCTTESKY